MRTHLPSVCIKTHAHVAGFYGFRGKQRNPVFSALRREGLFNKQKARDIPLLFSLGRFFEFLRFFPRAQLLKECPQHFRAFLFQQPGDNLGFVVVRNVE